MARPQKAIVDYFPHWVKRGKTILALESRFGNDGYAFWFKLLEILGETENHFFDCNNPANMEYLLAITKVSEETASNILDLLVKVDAIDRDLWQEKIIWSQNFVDGVKDAYKRRKIGLPQKPSLCKQKSVSEGINVSINDALTPECADINPQSKVNKSKVNKSKLYKYSDAHLALAQYLLECIKNNKPDFKDPNIEQWADSIRLMQENDKREQEKIREVIRWCQSDSFWKTNILSADKLRKQFDKLELQMNQKKGTSQQLTPAMQSIQEWMNSD